MKIKCDRLEREKSDLLLRRLAAMETTTSKTTATEVSVDMFSDNGGHYDRASLRISMRKSNEFS